MNQVLPNANEWSEFLSNRKNKLQLCNLLGDYFTSGEITTEKKLEKGKKKICYIKRPDQIRQVCPLLYSEHKEADHGIVSHAKYANDNDNNENSSITIVADDTDIYILLIRIACYCRSILYFSRDTSSSKEDFTKTFYRRSKIQSFKKMLTL